MKNLLASILLVCLVLGSSASPLFFGQNVTTGAVTNTWIDSVTLTTATNAANNNSGNVYWDNAGLVMPAGTFDQVRVRIKNYYGGGAVNVRASINNATGAVVASGNASIAASDSTLTITLTASYAQSGGTYRVLFTGANSNIDWGYATGTGTIDQGNTYGYSGAPSTVPGVSSTVSSAIFGCGIHLQ